MAAAIVLRHRPPGEVEVPSCSFLSYSDIVYLVLFIRIYVNEIKLTLIGQHFSSKLLQCTWPFKKVWEWGLSRPA